MKKKYQLYSRKQDIRKFISELHREEFLAIGILDNSNLEDLRETTAWYVKNFNHNIHVITDNGRFSPEQIQNSFPDVNFIFFDKTPSLAESLNALANECKTTYFFVTGADSELVSFDWNGILKQMQSDEHPAALCPLMFNRSRELIPTVRAPHLNHGEVEPMSFMPGHKPSPNLYPFLGLGIYDRALFQRLRGYDEEIGGDYYQAMDFGTRCWLYGYPLYTVEYIAMYFFSKQFLIEDRSEKEGVARFYSKALAVHKKGGKTVIKKPVRFDRRFFRTEVRPRLALYKSDYETICTLWKAPEDAN